MTESPLGTGPDEQDRDSESIPGPDEPASDPEGDDTVEEPMSGTS